MLGVSAILYSLLTDYELGLLRVVPFSFHLGLDIGSGILLAASPWLFQFAERVWIPHVVVGLFEILAGLMTRNTRSGIGCRNSSALRTLCTRSFGGRCPAGKNDGIAAEGRGISFPGEWARPSV